MSSWTKTLYQGADKPLDQPGKKRARKRLRNARDFNNIETRAVIKFFFPLQGKAPKKTFACFLPGQAKDLSAHLKFSKLLPGSISTLSNNALKEILTFQMSPRTVSRAPCCPRAMGWAGLLYPLVRRNSDSDTVTHRIGFEASIPKFERYKY